MFLNFERHWLTGWKGYSDTVGGHFVKTQLLHTHYKIILLWLVPKVVMTLLYICIYGRLKASSHYTCNAHLMRIWAFTELPVAAVRISGIEMHVFIAMFVPMAAAGLSTEKTKTKIRSVGQICHFTCEYVACKAIMSFYSPRVFSTICYPFNT